MLLATHRATCWILGVGVWIGAFLGDFEKCAGQDQAGEKAHSVKKLIDLRTKGMITFYGFLPDNETLVYSDGTCPDNSHFFSEFVKVDLKNGNAPSRSDLRKGSAAMSLLSHDGKVLAMAGGRKVPPILWDVNTWKKVSELKVPDFATWRDLAMIALPQAFSPDGKQILGGIHPIGSTRFLFWDTASGAYRLAGKNDEFPEAIPYVVHGPGFQPNYQGPSRTPQAIAFARPNGPFAYLLFENVFSGMTRHLYDVSKDKLIPLKQVGPGFHGPFDRPDLRVVNLPLVSMDLWELQGEGFGGLTAFPFDLWRFRLSPISGRVVIVPKYAKAPFRIVAEPAGTMAIVPNLPDDLLTRHKDWVPPPAKPGMEIVRLTDFKGARKGTWSFQLSPDATKLAAVWTDPPRPKDYTAKAIESPSLLIVWDVSSLHEEAVKHRQAKAPKSLDDWVAAKTGLAPDRERTARWFRDNIGGDDPYPNLAAMTALSFYPKEAVPLLAKLVRDGRATLYALDFFEQFPSAEARQVLEAISAGGHGDEAAQLAKISLKTFPKK